MLCAPCWQQSNVACCTTKEYSVLHFGNHHELFVTTKGCSVPPVGNKKGRCRHTEYGPIRCTTRVRQFLASWPGKKAATLTSLSTFMLSFLNHYVAIPLTPTPPNPNTTINPTLPIHFTHPPMHLTHTTRHIHTLPHTHTGAPALLHTKNPHQNTCTYTCIHTNTPHSHPHLAAMS
jgi:hypothetical protein